MAKNAINERSDEEFTVERVGVAAVGPSGLFLRAHVHQNQLLFTSSSNHDGLIMEIPIGFHSPATTIDELRLSVLGMVEDAEG